MSKEIKTTTISFTEKNEEGFKDPSKWFIMNCLGEYIYFHKRSREDAQKQCNELYGVGKYKVIASSNEKSGGNLSCRGSLNSKSMAGQRMNSIRNSQGRGM